MQRYNKFLELPNKLHNKCTIKTCHALKKIESKKCVAEEIQRKALVVSLS